MKEELLLDSFCRTGNTVESFREYCEEMDSVTEHIIVDYSQSNVLNYLCSDNGKAKFYNASSCSITPGEKLTVLQEEVVSIPLMKTENGKVKKEKALTELVKEMTYKQERDDKFGTIFSSVDTDDNDLYLFPGTTSFCTFKSFPVNITKSCIERDLFLAKELLEAPSSVILNTTVRRIGNFGKIIGYFSENNNNNISYTKFLDVLESLGSGKLIKWKGQQKLTEVYYQFDEEVNEIKRLYPSLSYEPVHIFTICDSGRVANGITSGWFSKELNAFISSTSFNAKKNDYEKAFNEVINLHKKEAANMAKDIEQIINGSVEQTFESALFASEVVLEAGLKKCVKKMQQYVSKESEKLDTDTNMHEVKNLALKFAASTKNEDDLSNMIKEKLPRIVGKIVLK